MLDCVLEHVIVHAALGCRDRFGVGGDRRNPDESGKAEAVKEGELHILISFIRYLRLFLTNSINYL
jgi:hypothetical protein